MATISYYARGDSSTANNAALNVPNTNKVPTTLLTFEDIDIDGNQGDLNLDLFISGAIDPDTVVYVNGDLDNPLTFTVEFRGLLPTKNSLASVGPDGINLQGLEVTVLTLSNGDRYFIITDPSTLDTFAFNPDDFLTPADNPAFRAMDAFPNGAFALTNVEVCYAAGTLIATLEGPRPVEDPTPGNMLATLDDRPARVEMLVARTALARDMQIFDTLRPVTLPAGLLGPGRPARDLTVTPLHRILLDDPDLGRIFGEERMYVFARDIPGVVRGAVADRTYYHIVCDHHAALVAEGLGSESLYPGDVALLRLPPKERAAVEAVFGDRPRRTAFPCLTGKEAAVWRKAVQSREKRAACTGVQ